MSEAKEEVPFLKWARSQIIGAAVEIEMARVDEVFEKIAVYVQGAESERDAAKDVAAEWQKAAEAAQAALVHATNRLSETDALVAELRQHAVHGELAEGELLPTYHHGIPTGDGHGWTTADELNSLVASHKNVCADNAAWQRRYERAVLALRWCDENAPALRERHPIPQGLKEALGFA